MKGRQTALQRAGTFAEAFGLEVPIIQAPMAGACPPALSIAVANAGGMGGCGVVTMSPDAIEAWVNEMRAGSNGAFQLNTWVPDPEPARDLEHEAAVRAFLSNWGPEVPPQAADAPPPDFEAQCQAMLAAGPAVISSIMGLYSPDFVSQMKERRIKWFATVTTVAEAIAAQEAGADVIVAQGMEAGGHRGAFRDENAESNMVGLFSLLPAVVDAVDRPVVATGGIADARGVAAALVLGASAVQIGTAFLRAPEVGLPSSWADAIRTAEPEDVITTRAYSGRLARTIRNDFTTAAASPDVPKPAAYPIQRNLTQAMRSAALQANRTDVIAALAGQSARLAQARSAKDIMQELWRGAVDLLE